MSLVSTKDIADDPADMLALVNHNGLELSDRIRALQLDTTPKTIRRFRPPEAAELLSITEGRLRQLAGEGLGPEPQANGWRTYSAENIKALRSYLSEKGRGRYNPSREPHQSLQLISTLNFKGGSGKTTTAAHLAQYLALRGYRVLAVDLDPQASLTALFGMQAEFDVGDNDTIFGAIRYDAERRPLSEIVRSTYIPDLYIIPGNLELQEFEHHTANLFKDEDRARRLRPFSRIRMAISEVEENFDVVIFDCPPSLGFISLSALVASTGFLVTVHPQMLDVLSMSQFLNMTHAYLYTAAKQAGEFDLKWLRYLVTRHEPADGPQNQIVTLLRSTFREQVLHNTMVKSTTIVDAGLTKQTLYELDPRQLKNRGAYDRAIKSLNAVNAEIEELIQNTWAGENQTQATAKA